MENVVLVIHLLLALAIIGLVLLQRSEGGGLGIGGSGGGLGNLASAKSMGNALTKATAWCAVAFFCTSLFLGVLAGRHSNAGKSILDQLDEKPLSAEISMPMDEAETDTPVAPAASAPEAVTPVTAPTETTTPATTKSPAEGEAASTEPPSVPIAE